MFYRQNADQVAAERFDEELVLIQFGRGTYFSLRNSAVDIWQQFEKGATPEQVGDRVAARFSLLGEEARAEVERCIRTLIEEELLCETNAASPPTMDWVSEAYGPPVVEVYSDLRDLIVLDPVHEVDDRIGWPRRPGDAQGD